MRSETDVVDRDDIVELRRKNLNRRLVAQRAIEAVISDFARELVPQIFEVRHGTQDQVEREIDRAYRLGGDTWRRVEAYWDGAVARVWASAHDWARESLEAAEHIGEIAGEIEVVMAERTTCIAALRPEKAAERGPTLQEVLGLEAWLERRLADERARWLGYGRVLADPELLAERQLRSRPSLVAVPKKDESTLDELIEQCWASLGAQERRQVNASAAI